MMLDQPVTDPVSLQTAGQIGIVTIDLPPVNALSEAVRRGLMRCFQAGFADSGIKAIVLICKGRTFIAGADLKEFGSARKGPSLLEILDLIEQAPIPVIAAIHGTALGGGFEVALACHYRIAVPSAQMGLPEVNVGLLPGAGGTQRLPRVVGIAKALDLIMSGRRVPGPEARTLGIVDELAEESRLLKGATDIAQRIIDTGSLLRRLRDEAVTIGSDQTRNEIFDDYEKTNAKKLRNRLAPRKIRLALEAAIDLPFDEGMKLERELFLELLESDQSKALRYAFFAERQARNVLGNSAVTPRYLIESVGVVGTGTMGQGIAAIFAIQGYPVTVVEADEARLSAGLEVIRNAVERRADRQKKSRINGSVELATLENCDLIIEAVTEDLVVKSSVFADLDRIAKSGAILATSTSYTDVDALARRSSRPDKVVGLHFLFPSAAVRLLEVVRGSATSTEVIATCFDLAKALQKAPVVVGNGWGFAANRMFSKYKAEAERLVLEGATPWHVDSVLYEFGFPMGPFAVCDLTGLDLGRNGKKSNGKGVVDLLNKNGRHGRKSGAGSYDNESDGTPAIPSHTLELIDPYRIKSGIRRYGVTDEEILSRCVFVILNEGLKLLEEGRVSRLSDIDVIWLNGFGWPAYRGGPIHYAESVGVGAMFDEWAAWRTTAPNDADLSTLLLECVTDDNRLTALMQGSR
jgi:3-hydroxyacyl-CoA dehydrogenase